MHRRLIPAILAAGTLVATSIPAMAAKPPLEPMYANDATVFMSAPANAVAAGGVNNAQDFYLIVYPVVPAGVHPLCDPCANPPDIPHFRDVVLNGSQGFGTDGTAGAFNPHWHVLLLVYSPDWLNNPAFQPARSAAELDAGEAAGHFLPVAPGTENPFELDTGIIFLCVLVSQHA